MGLGSHEERKKAENVSYTRSLQNQHLSLGLTVSRSLSPSLSPPYLSLARQPRAVPSCAFCACMKISLFLSISLFLKPASRSLPLSYTVSWLMSIPTKDEINTEPGMPTRLRTGVNDLQPQCINIASASSRRAGSVSFFQRVLCLCWSF